MNIAAKEFIEKGAEWGYATLSKLAKDHGGAKQFIADVYENGYLDGYYDALKGEKMKRLGIIGVSVTTLIGIGGVAVHFYKKSKAKEKELEEQIAETARLKGELYTNELLASDKSKPNGELSDNVVVVDFTKHGNQAQGA